MLYCDLLYGTWKLPPAIEKLAHTKEMARLRNITQSTLPNNLIVEGALPSRFHHGLGVCHLAQIVVNNNRDLKEYKTLLPVAALLHDAGNPPFSHTSEHFLKEMTGKNGESFLEDILDGSETEKVLKDFGMTSKQVVDLVAGLDKPISDVLHGSMDLDNLDNVGRHNKVMRSGGPEFDAQKIASRFRFDKEWYLGSSVRANAEMWRYCRLAVYRNIYSQPHLNIGIMIYRALEIAFCEGDLHRNFFFLDDVKALNFLLEKCNPKTAYLADQAIRWNWYHEVFSMEYKYPSGKFKKLAESWRGRKYLADTVAHKLKIPQKKVCVYIGAGKEKRKIKIPFLFPGGLRRYDDSDDSPVYRIKIYVPEEFINKAGATRDIVLGEIS